MIFVLKKNSFLVKVEPFPGVRLKVAKNAERGRKVLFREKCLEDSTLENAMVENTSENKTDFDEKEKRLKMYEVSSAYGRRRVSEMSSMLSEELDATLGCCCCCCCVFFFFFFFFF